MSQPTSKHHYKNWLESLQRESWQLELLITGFAIVLLIGATEMVETASLKARYLAYGLKDSFMVGIFIIVLIGTWIFLLINLLLHVVLRGLWISTIGLRSVSGQIRLQRLRFMPRYERFLIKRMPAFDIYIDRLDRISSVVFAFTFLILFSFISFGLFALSLYFSAALLKFILGYILNDSHSIDIIVRGFSLVFFMLGLLYFIDYITLGFFKRRKWAKRWYFPIYKAMGWITLAALYRPIYYNLIDNKFGRRIGLILVPYIVLVMFLTSLHFRTHPYYPNQGLENLSIRDLYYDDKREEKKVIDHPSISSPFVEKGFLEVFLPYLPNEDDQAIKYFCPSLEAHKTGLTNDLVTIDDSKKINYQSLAQQSRDCIAKVYQLSIADSTFYKPSFYFYEHKNLKEKGLKTVLDIDYLDRGAYQLVVNKAQILDDSLSWETFARIPFWKE